MMITNVLFGLLNLFCKNTKTNNDKDNKYSCLTNKNVFKKP